MYNINLYILTLNLCLPPSLPLAFVRATSAPLMNAYPPLKPAVFHSATATRLYLQSHVFSTTAGMDVFNYGTVNWHCELALCTDLDIADTKHWSQPPTPPR